MIMMLLFLVLSKKSERKALTGPMNLEAAADI